jgi:hypothetical protein
VAPQFAKLLSQPLNLFEERFLERGPLRLAEVPLEGMFGALDLVERSTKHGHHDLVRLLVVRHAADVADDQPRTPSALMLADGRVVVA